MKHVLLDNGIVRIDTIKGIDFTKADLLELTVTHDGGIDVVTGFAAIELLWLVKPSVLEGKWRNWRKHTWVIHNLFAHPLMQILAFMRLYKWAIWVHDVTVPKPTNQL